MGASLGLLVLLVLCSSPSEPADGAAGFVGQYGALRSRPARCDLEITNRATFSLRCGTHPVSSGVVRLWGNALVFGVELKPGDTPVPQLDEYLKARGTYMREHFLQFGYYPVVAPPDSAMLHHDVPMPLVPVGFTGHVYLVDARERELFCEAAAASRTPKKGEAPNLIFRSRGKLPSSPALPWEEFCRAGWTLTLEPR